MNLSVRLPLGTARRLAGQSLDVESILEETMKSGFIRSVKMVPYHFRYQPINVHISNKSYDKLLEYMPNFSDTIYAERYLGVLISAYHSIPVLPISGSLPNTQVTEAVKALNAFLSRRPEKVE
jgi:hypothetical protein